MARMTRNSYKRKIIVIGIMVFVSIALISTGFAAWIISTNAKEESQGNISVGKVTDGAIDIVDVTLSTDSFYFEPAEGDYTGRVRNEKGENAKSESLKVTITGKVTNAQFLDELSIKLNFSNNDTQNPAEAVGLAAAAAAGFIELPDCAVSEVVIDESNGLVKTSETEYNFTYTIEFFWGEKFGRMNPSLYFDTDPEGMAIDDDQMSELLTTFRDTMYQGIAGYEGANADAPEMKFNIVLIGTVN